MASVEEYLKLEFLRFGDKFDYEIDAVKVEDVQKWEVVPGMVQPFVENAIWHGVRGLEGRKGIIHIVFEFNGADHLQCLITDDGIGRDLSGKRRSLNPDRKSRGIEMVKERLRIINDLKKRNYQVLIEDLIPGKEECGTRVSIDLPVRRKRSSP